MDKVLCDECLIKQMIRHGEECYWPNEKNVFEYFLPEVNITTCHYVSRIISSIRISEDDKQMFNECELFIPQIDWIGMKKADIKVLSSLSDYLYLSLGERPNLSNLLAALQKIRLEEGLNIRQGVGAGNTIATQFNFQRENYKLFGLVRDEIAAALS